MVYFELSKVLSKRSIFVHKRSDKIYSDNTYMFQCKIYYNKTRPSKILSFLNPYMYRQKKVGIAFAFHLQFCYCIIYTVQSCFPMIILIKIKCNSISLPEIFLFYFKVYIWETFYFNLKSNKSGNEINNNYIKHGIVKTWSMFNNYEA